MASRRDRITRIAVHAIGTSPLAYLLIASLATWPLGLMDAATLREQYSGLGTITMTALWATLACTPLNIMFGWKRPLRHRKALGLYTFAYAITHLGAFAADSGFVPSALWAASLEQAFLVWGAIAVALLVPLALTSNRWSMARLGRNWKRLHWLTYVVAVAVVIHLALIPGEPGEALVPGILLAVLLGVRVPPVRRAVARGRRARSQRRVAATA